MFCCSALELQRLWPMDLHRDYLVNGSRRDAEVSKCHDSRGKPSICAAKKERVSKPLLDPPSDSRCSFLFCNEGVTQYLENTGLL